MVAFCPFDNAALLCSLLIHDIDGTIVPRRAEVICAIGQALHISHRLRGFTRLGDVTWSILSALKNRINLHPYERQLLDEIESVEKAGAMAQVLKDSFESGDGLWHSNNRPISDLQPASGEGMRFGENTPLVYDDEFLEMDLGILDGVWNWERVGF